MNLYRIGNTIINADQIVDVQFTPEHLIEAHIDEESGQHVPERTQKAKLVVTTTALKMDEASDYQGNFQGAASISEVHNFKGKEAEQLFELFCAHSVQVTGE